jgi:hypothetical protein
MHDDLRPASPTIKFEAFGVRIAIAGNCPPILELIEKRLPKIAPGGFKRLRNENFDHSFFIKEKPNENLFEIYKNSEKIEWWKDKERLLEYLDSQLRITIAEFAVSKVFIHAGVVAWKENAIIIPGNSRSGKTTMVAEFIKRGAIYYSDEYAVVDDKGCVHAFPKMLSIRGIVDDFTQVDFAPEDLGAAVGIKPLPVKMILITQFEENAAWNPWKLKTGEGIMEVLPHTIPTRLNPAFTLKVLSLMASRAIIAKSVRGEAKLILPVLIDYLETEINKADSEIRI